MRPCIRVAIAALLAREPAADAPTLAQLQAEIVRLEKELGEARTDPLTGLPCRRAWTQQAKVILQQPEDVYVLLLDLMKFKAVNDTFGHEAGDWMLRSQGSRLRMWCERIAGDAFAGRLGGDEMAAVVRLAPAELAGALDVLGDVLAQPVFYEGLRLQAPAAIGVATAAPGYELDVLMKAADLAMYAAKGGLGRWWHMATQIPAAAEREPALPMAARSAPRSGPVQAPVGLD